MNIIICGAGKVGFSISKQLSAQGHSVTIIDQSSDDIKKINDTQDVKGLLEELLTYCFRKCRCRKSRHDNCSQEMMKQI